MSWLRGIYQRWCGWHGHRWLRRFEDGRYFLECDRCGKSSEGWPLK
jgi:hypothetical protein